MACPLLIGFTKTDNACSGKQGKHVERLKKGQQALGGAGAISERQESFIPYSKQLDPKCRNTLEIGHSSCGKSTILTMVTGLNEISAEGISLDGKEIDGAGIDARSRLHPIAHHKRSTVHEYKEKDSEKEKKQCFR